jgi:hypothetical protein
VRRVIERVRRYFPKARLRVRLDSAYATPEILDYLDEAKGGICGEFDC